MTSQQLFTVTQGQLKAERAMARFMVVVAFLFGLVMGLVW